MKTHPVYLNGEFVTTEESIPIVNPANGEAFARMSRISREKVREAISVAHEAFGRWRQTTAKERGEWLLKCAAELENRREEMARVITRENGKPLAQSLAEVNMSLDHLRWFAEEARRAYGRLIPHWTEGKRNLVVKSPMGVAGAISPWNFPLVLAVRKVAPALAAGCAVLLKPASQTPLCSVLLAECFHAAGFPKGVFQLVQGVASEIGAEFLQNPLCRKISFTGSTAVGQQLIEGAAERVKPLALELGGHAPALVFADANLERALDGVMMAKFRNSGQSCIAANRVYVERSIYPDFLEAFAARVKAQKVGDGFDPEAVIGPLIDQAAVAKATAHIEDAIRRGARLLCGGKPMSERAGWFFQPTVLADVPDDSLCCCEETFAPVAPVSPFDSEAEAIQRANHSDFGLSAYAFTQDLGRAIRLMETLEAGMIGINDGVPTATQAPFGGVKMSGWGRELGLEGIDAFLETKHVSIGIG
jgi:succinate-semialdehyde dehydrogenase / glutarate-semialdehyde dehydrogenase